MKTAAKRISEPVVEKRQLRRLTDASIERREIKTARTGFFKRIIEFLFEKNVNAVRSQDRNKEELETLEIATNTSDRVRKNNQASPPSSGERNKTAINGTRKRRESG